MYNEYYEKLIEKNVERQNEFVNNIIFSHNENNYYTNARQIHSIKYNFIISSNITSVYEVKGFIVEIYIDNVHFKSYFNQLKALKEEIETNIGQSLVWQERPTICRIFAKLEIENIQNETKWNEYIDWQINTMIKFLQVFPTYTANLTNEIEGVIEMSDMLRQNRIITTEEHIKDLYSKFKNYYISNKDNFFGFRESEIKSDISQRILNENNFLWNSNSLNMYIQSLIKMMKGTQFNMIINNFAKEYFIENIKNDFGLNFYEKAKNALELHEKYILNIREKRKIRINNLEEIENYENIYLSNINTKNIILYGVPGVGKTHNINKLINLIEKNEDSEQEIFSKIAQNSESNEVLDDENLKSRVVFTTFHQSFAYEDFIEGFRPNNAGQITLRDGIFKTICEDATNDKYNNYYLVIDEINRGNIPKIFGELITLIEESKRDKLEILLPYSQKTFSVPSNLFIIGTMNSTDKSIALIDIALRRRFTFLELKPNETLIQNLEAREFFKKLSEQLEDDYKIGHSYFMGENIDLKFVKEYKIKPLLKEYFYGNNQKLEEIMKNLE